MTFSILDHIDKLNHLGRGRYNCPVCNGSALTINKKTGAYRCHSGECESALIRNAIAPMPKDGITAEPKQKVKSAPKPKAKPVYIAPDSVTLGCLSGDRTYPKKIPNSNGGTTTEYFYKEDFSLFVRRIDFEDPKKPKEIRPWHYDRESTDLKKGKGDLPWDAYRIEEALEYGAGHFVVLVEGEKCVEAMRWIGIPAITFQGGAWTDDDFSRAIAKLKGRVNGLVIIPDHDEAGYKKADKVIAACAAHSYPALLLNPLDIWRNMPQRGDVADWIKAEQSDPSVARGLIEWAIDKALENQNYKQKLEDAKEIVGTLYDAPAVVAETSRPLESPKPLTSSVHGGSKNLNAKELLDFIQNELGDRLKFDDLTSEIILDDEPLKFGSDIKFWFLDMFGESANKEDIYDALTYKAKQKSFNPVAEYLEKCHATAPRVDITNISSRYFGTVEPIFDRMVEMWLISAVARVYNPGCQVDHTLILQSGQGKYKSTWFKTLGGEWFSDSVKDIENKDSLLTMHSSWIIELSELDRITSKKQAGAVKHFLTQREDTFRKPYGKEVARNQRRNLFCGTVNPARFLVDDENRRFWIIPIGDHVSALDIPLLEKERDGIWAAAVDALVSGSPWYPTEEEKALISMINKGFEDIDVWQEPIESWISNLPYVSVYEILSECFKFETNQMQRRDEMRVAKILTRLGWTKETRREVFGKSRRVRLNPREVGTTDENSYALNIPYQPINNINGKVGNVGKSLVPQSLEPYQPTNQPSDRSVNMEGRYIPTSTNGVGQPQTQTQQAIYQPTNQNQHNPQTSLSSEAMAFKVGDRIVDIRTNQIGTIRALPEFGVTWVKKSHTVEYDDGSTELVDLCYLVRYGS